MAKYNAAPRAGLDPPDTTIVLLNDLLAERLVNARLEIYFAARARRLNPSEEGISFHAPFCHNDDLV
ncbi:MAG TPA: hypothetical protein VNN62_20535 [Methylomirabilota bacterium]|nr:hypothetical protein [Methylomirabilota bacterium]